MKKTLAALCVLTFVSLCGAETATTNMGVRRHNQTVSVKELCVDTDGTGCASRLSQPGGVSLLGVDISGDGTVDITFDSDHVFGDPGSPALVLKSWQSSCSPTGLMACRPGITLDPGDPLLGTWTIMNGTHGTGSTPQFDIRGVFDEDGDGDVDYGASRYVFQIKPIIPGTGNQLFWQVRNRTDDEWTTGFGVSYDSGGSCMTKHSHLGKAATVTFGDAEFCAQDAEDLFTSGTLGVSLSVTGTVTGDNIPVVGCTASEIETAECADPQMTGQLAHAVDTREWYLGNILTGWFPFAMPSCASISASIGSTNVTCGSTGENWRACLLDSQMWSCQKVGSSDYYWRPIKQDFGATANMIPTTDADGRLEALGYLTVNASHNSLEVDDNSSTSYCYGATGPDADCDGISNDEPDSHTGLVVYSDGTNTTHDTGTLVCAVMDRACVTTYSLAGSVQLCSYDWGSGTPFQAVCR